MSPLGLTLLWHLVLGRAPGYTQRFTIFLRGIQGIQPRARPFTFQTQLVMETKVQENKVRQMEFPFQKANCLLSMTHACPGAFGSAQQLEAARFSCPGPTGTPQQVSVGVWADPPTLLGFIALSCLGPVPCSAVWARQFGSHSGKTVFAHPLTQPGRQRQAKALAQ